MKKIVVIFILNLLLGCAYSALCAQTKADSLTIISTRWDIQDIGNGIVHKRALFKHLYKGAQHVNILVIKKNSHNNFNIAISDPLMKTSDLASANNAIAAINGSYFDMHNGNSVCFLKIGKELKDTTTNREWQARITGAIYVHKGKLKLLPWNRKSENRYKKRKRRYIIIN